jgi:hypothetical protein
LGEVILVPILRQFYFCPGGFASGKKRLHRYYRVGKDPKKVLFATADSLGE